MPMTDDRPQQTQHNRSCYDSRHAYYQPQPQVESHPYMHPDPYPNMQLRDGVALSPSHYPDSVPPWHVPVIHPRSQERHATAYANQPTFGYDHWHHTQHDVPFTHPASATAQSGNIEPGCVPRSAEHHQDDTIPADHNPHVPSLSNDLQPDRATVIGHEPHANRQPIRSTTENSEFLLSLARRYILDPRASVGTILMEPIGYGLVEMIITLKMTENVQV
ncbi:hypothetical protein EI94DRAFT_1740349 [Lactarius quietus]|nr:hypothetical protein EI94DRAFT_1740349 [Lactarius quietus]